MPAMSAEDEASAGPGPEEDSKSPATEDLDIDLDAESAPSQKFDLNVALSALASDNTDQSEQLEKGKEPRRSPSLRFGL